MVHRRGLPLVLGLALVVGLLVGCQAMAPRGPSDEEQIRTLINKFVDAANKGDAETVMAAFADDFTFESGEGKEELQALLEEGLATGVEFDASDIEIKIAADGNSAEVEGVAIDYTPYAATLKKRGGKWLITSGAEQY